MLDHKVPEAFTIQGLSTAAIAHVSAPLWVKTEDGTLGVSKGDLPKAETFSTALIIALGASPFSEPPCCTCRSPGRGFVDLPMGYSTLDQADPLSTTNRSRYTATGPLTGDLQLLVLGDSRLPVPSKQLPAIFCDHSSISLSTTL